MKNIHTAVGFEPVLPRNRDVATPRSKDLVKVLDVAVFRHYLVLTGSYCGTLPYVLGHYLVNSRWVLT